MVKHNRFLVGGAAGAAFAAIALGLGACQTPTEATMVYSTDVPCIQMNGMAISVYSSGSQTDPVPLTETTQCDQSTGQIGSLVLTPGQLQSGVVVESVLGIGVAPEDCSPGKAGCAYERRLLNYESHEDLSIPVDIPLVCGGVECEFNQTCVSGPNGAAACTSYKIDCSSTGTCKLVADEDGGGLFPPLEDDASASNDAMSSDDTNSFGGDTSTSQMDAGEDATLNNEDGSSPGEDGSGPEDGSTPLDSTLPGMDSGAPGTDSGAPGTDSGSPGTDSGTPGTDSGSPGTDSGSPSQDSGVFTGDAGAYPDSGFTPSTSTPPNFSGSNLTLLDGGNAVYFANSSEDFEVTTRPLEPFSTGNAEVSVGMNEFGGGSNWVLDGPQTWVYFAQNDTGEANLSRVVTNSARAATGLQTIFYYGDMGGFAQTIGIFTGSLAGTVCMANTAFDSSNSYYLNCASASQLSGYDGGAQVLPTLVLTVNPASSVNSNAAATDGTNFYFGSSANSMSLVYSLPVTATNANVGTLSASMQFPGTLGDIFFGGAGPDSPGELCGFLTNTTKVIECGLGSGLTGEDIGMRRSPPRARGAVVLPQGMWSLSPLNGATFVNFVFYSESIIATQSDGTILAYPYSYQNPVIIARNQSTNPIVYGALPGPTAGTTVVYWQSSGQVVYATVPALP